MQGMWYWQAVDIVDVEGGKKIKLEDSWLMQIRGTGKIILQWERRWTVTLEKPPELFSI